MSETEDIKVWQARSAWQKVASVLIMEGVSFRYDEENGITFTAPDFYVEKLKERLVYAHGCSVRPIIKEIK